MRNKMYRKWIGLLLGATMLTTSFSGVPTVLADTVIGENLIVNPGFEDGDTGWTHSSGGFEIGTNNPHSDAKHFYLASGDYELSQKLTIPADGTYECSVFISAGDVGGSFGVRKADGTVLYQTDVQKSNYSGNKSEYQEYNTGSLELKEGDIVEVFVTSGKYWTNGDDFSFVCTKLAEEESTQTNLVVNPGFENDKEGWTFPASGAGIATNNKHSGTKHFYLDGGVGQYEISQQIEVQTDGSYEGSVWIASGGNNGEFGVRKVTTDGKESLYTTSISAAGYQEYKTDSISLKKGDVVEIYVTSGNAWINGDDFSFICTKADTTDPEQPETPEQPENPEDTSGYIFSGNMVRNDDFNDGTNNWTISSGGTATNNGYPAGDTHYYLDGSAYMEQEITVPYTGHYTASTWASTSGKNGSFGIKMSDSGEVVSSVDLENGKPYKQYTLSDISLKKGDKIKIYVQGMTGWTNGDKFSLTFNDMEYGNLLINSNFTDSEVWSATAATVGSGSAVLDSETSDISQTFYVPKAGPYVAEVELENAENATVFLGSSSQTVSGSQTVRVKLADLKVGAEVIAKVSGKATVKSFTVKYDLAEMGESKPSVADVTVTGDIEVGNSLQGNYTYQEADGRKEGNSSFQWYIADKADGDYTPIEGENGKELELTEDMINKYVKFSVTPVDEYLGIGDAAYSDPAGPIFMNIVPNNGFEEGQGNWKDITAEKVVDAIYAHDGIYRGTLQAGKTGYQIITVPHTGYYSLSAYIRCPKKQSNASSISVRDQAGNVIKEVEIPAGQLNGTFQYFELTDIPVEEGMEVQVAFTAGDQIIYVDDVVMKVNAGDELPAFSNILGISTTPDTYEKGVSTQKKEITLKYYYETDLSRITIDELKLSAGATASVQAGDVLDLTSDYKVTVTDKDGNTSEWTIKAEEAEKKVVLHSSNQYLEDTFNWAAQKQRQFVMTGQTGAINVPQASGQTADYIPSYWAGYYDRTAFYARDFVHQATGGQIAGLEEENFSMFKAFAKECTEERQWYTVWALNFDGSVYTMDYYGPNSFVREVPAQFELVEKAYKQYLWSGDKRYIEDEDLWNFYTNVMTKYVDSHDANRNGVAQEVGTGIFQGSCTYNERGRRVIESGDAIGSQYQATLAYAAMLEARGDHAASEAWYQKAADLKKYFNDEWSVSDNMQSEYVCAWGPNGERYSDFSKETSWFMPLKMITEAGEKNDAYIDFILENLGNGIGTTSTAPSNLEAYTYIPDMLFLYNRSDDAWKWMKYITSIKDEPHERPIQGTNGDYPEISFTFVSHTIEGMMGVEPDAGNNFIATVPRLPQEVPDVTADHIDIGDSELSLTHIGNTESTLTNVSGNGLTWEARFYGDYQYIKIGDEYVKAEQKELNGELISYAATTVAQGASVTARAVTDENENKEVAESEQRVSEVITQINGLGEITLDSRAAVQAARAAYDALSAEEKAKVTNLFVLEAAEKRIAELEKAAEKPDDGKDNGDDSGNNDGNSGNNNNGSGGSNNNNGTNGGNNAGSNNDTNNNNNAGGSGKNTTSPSGTVVSDASSNGIDAGTASGENSSSTTEEASTGAVKTGDVAGIAGILLAIGASIGGISVGLRKKREDEDEIDDLE